METVIRDSRNLLVFLIVLMLSSKCVSVKSIGYAADKLDFNDSDISRVISTLPIDSRPELPLHIVIEKSDKNVLIARICQSRFSSRVDFTKKLRVSGHDVFVYDFSKDGSNNVIFFNQDSPTWRILIYRYEEVIHYFRMDLIDL